jgi:pseudolysin
MNNKVYLSPIAAFFAMTLTQPLNAASPLLLDKTSLQDLKKQFDIVLPPTPSQGVKNTTAAAKIQSANSPVNTLSFITSHRGKNRVNHSRMQQTYEGFPVDGGYGILHSTSSPEAISAKQNNNNNVKMTGVIYQGLSNELGKPPHDFVNNATHVLAHFKTAFKGKVVSDEEVEPIVYIDDEDKAHWAYRLRMLVVLPDAIPERPTAIIDALTHQILVQWNDMKTDRLPTNGVGFGGNEKTGRFSYGMPEDSQSLPYLKITRTHSGRNGITCFMENNDVKVVDMKHLYSSSNQPMKFPCMPVVLEKNPDAFWTGYHGDGLDASNGAYSPSNDALFAGDIVKRMYLVWYQTEALVNADGSPMQLTMRVHYGNGYANAYWDGKQMTFGDGTLTRPDDRWPRSSIKMHPLVSLGIAAHEVSHGFTEQHANLRYIGQAGGMNESFSDMAAQAAEMYALGKNSWKVGVEIMKAASNRDTLRYMDIPSKDGESIDSAKDYYEGMDPHNSSGVYNRLFYLLSEEEGWNVQKAFAVMVEANMHYWLPRSTYIQGACGILSAAKDLGYDMDAIKRSLDGVAIDYHTCV